MRACAVIPVYNHGAAIAAVVHAVQEHSLPCILVDDGSEPGCAVVLEQLAECDGVTLVRMKENRGKGAAMEAGMRHALQLGYTHALQIDADGQHDAADIPAFLKLAGNEPEKLICGCPLYDDDVPRARLYGRYATHIWVWINTLSFDIRDSMCGFRVYPLAATVSLLDRVSVGRRMDFDTDIVVRLYWRGMQVVNQPTRVRYPGDGVSHFRMLRDNLLISIMHARHFFGMLLRLPLLLWRKVTS